MSFEEFKKAVVERISKYFPSGEVSIQPVTKNNGMRLTGLTVKMDGENASPIIYLESFYNDYKDDVEKVIPIMAELVQQNARTFAIEELVDFGYCRDKIFPRLINAEMNQDMLEQLPHAMLCDLAIIYYVRIDMGDGFASVKVNSHMMEHFGITKEELHSIAIENLVKSNSSVFVDFFELMKGVPGFPQDPQEGGFMYVLTTKNGSFGSAAILDKTIMEKAVETLGTEFYCIPSSVDEFILFSKEVGESFIDNSVEIITTVNQSDVPEEDILSYHMYKYSVGRGLEIAR